MRHPGRYARSFFGVVDLASILPTYLAVFFPEAHALIDVRILRLLRVFRIFKLSAYIDADAKYCRRCGARLPEEDEAP